MTEYLQININGELILPAAICGAANLHEGQSRLPGRTQPEAFAG